MCSDSHARPGRLSSKNPSYPETYGVSVIEKTVRQNWKDDLTAPEKALHQ